MRNIVPIFITLISSFGPFAQESVELNLFAEGFSVPLDIVNAGDSMLYVVEKQGVIRLVDPSGSVLVTPFLDIRDRVNDTWSEQGLLGLAFHPTYPDSPYLYVNYSGGAGQTIVSRFEVNSMNTAQVVKASEKVLLTISQPFTNHNGGDLEFGPDGYLYIPTGDGGSGGDPEDNGQDYMALLGKLLRIDVDNGDPYAIPPDNPYAFDDFAADEIWATGLRNPWRIDFDPATGDLYIADVGQNRYEEINHQPDSSEGGENYGWRCYEADSSYNLSGCPDTSEMTFPVHFYERPLPPNCASITGGVVYRGSENPDWNGKYFFSDFCTGMMAVLYGENGEWMVDTLLDSDFRAPTGYGRDMHGEIYIAAPATGSVYKLSEPLSSIQEVHQDVRLVLENPVSGRLILDADIQFERGALYDMHGRTMVMIRNDQKELDISNFSAGVYVLQLESEGRLYTQKVIVE